MDAIHTGTIDELMERASVELARASYFAAERLCVEALRLAHFDRDYERLARLTLPLLEARRQKRQIALDAAESDLRGGAARAIWGSLPENPENLRPGCFLLQPPAIGAAARTLREVADDKGVPMFILTREPTTRLGKWPIVAIGQKVNGQMHSVRAYVDPPPGLVESERAGAGHDASAVPNVAWFVAAAESLGDVAIARSRPGPPTYQRVDDLVGMLDAVPEHEKLHQRLEEACRVAATEPPGGSRLGFDFSEDRGF